MNATQALRDAHEALIELTALVAQAEAFCNEAPRQARGPDPTSDTALDPHRMAVSRELYSSVMLMTQMSNKCAVAGVRLGQALNSYAGEDR